MRLTHTRKAIRTVRGTKLQKDLAMAVKSIERSNDQKVIAHRISSLIGFTMVLRQSLPKQTRFSVVDAIFVDAAAADVPHQWERKAGFECGSDKMCSKPNKKKTCYRDTSSDACETK
jgi:hypothetical protein